MAKKFKIVGRGYDVSSVTATAVDVLKDKVIVGPDGELIVGTMEIEATATADDLLIGQTAWVNGKKIIGTIPVYRSTDDEEPLNLMPGDTYNVPYGYYEEGALTIINQKMDFFNGSATVDDVLVGKTIYVDGELVEGTIPVKTVNSVAALSAGASRTLSSAYYAYDFTISAKDLASQTQATAAAGDIVQGETAWVNGEMITGTIPKYNYNDITTIDMGNSVAVYAGYYPKDFYIQAPTLASVTPGTASPSTILNGFTAWVNGSKYTGTYEPPTVDLAALTVADATADDLFVNKTAWVNGNKITGTMKKASTTQSILYNDALSTTATKIFTFTNELEIAVQMDVSMTSSGYYRNFVLIHKSVSGMHVQVINTDTGAWCDIAFKISNKVVSMWLSSTNGVSSPLYNVKITKVLSVISS